MIKDRKGPLEHLNKKLKKFWSYDYLKMSSVYFRQKLLCAILLAINVTLSVLSIVYYRYWYIFIVPLSVATIFNCFCVLSIVAVRLYELVFPRTLPEVTESKSLAFLVPCYNETRGELLKTLVSLTYQSDIDIHKRAMFIVCDGKVKGTDSDKTTDVILRDILRGECGLNAFTTGEVVFRSAYKTWSGEPNDLEIVYGNIAGVPFVCLIKENNVGKRDSLVLLRSLLYNYTRSMVNNDVSDEFQRFFSSFCATGGFSGFDYVIGTDADTEFELDCSAKLVREIDWDPSTHGVVGFVEVSRDSNQWSFWTVYQRTEYIVAQSLRRLQQSLVTKKVSCLSGCVQILRVSEETCGKKTLDAFNRYPTESDNVWTHILSFASEDRNHVCQMLHLYPYVKTRQCLGALAYTDVPQTISVFRSQRRRWSLGANSNDILLCFKSGINWFERIGAFCNILTYSLCLFIFVATITFIYSIIVHPTLMMLYLSVIIFIPISYEILIVVWYPFGSFGERVQFLFGLVLYLVLSPVINLLIALYSLSNVDCFKWG